MRPGGYSGHDGYSRRGQINPVDHPGSSRESPITISDLNDRTRELMTLSLFNVMFRSPVPGNDPTDGQLERVELPAWVTLVANAPLGTKSVRFAVDGTERFDDFPPFLLNEDGFGRARWQPTVGDHLVTARA